MKVIKLKDINLIYSNIPETEYNEWSSTTTYSIGDRVIVSYESDGTTERTPHEIYESLTVSNTGNYPPDNLDKWLLVSATNRWKMFDNYVNTQTENADTIEVVVDFSQCDSFALLNVDCLSVDWYLYNGNWTDSETLVDNGRISLSHPIYNWYDYFYGWIKLRTNMYKDNMVMYNTSQLRLVLNKPGGTAKCGIMRFGKSSQIGLTQYGVSISIIDYSKKITDEFGNTYLKQGNYAKKVDCDAWISNDNIDYVYKSLAELRSVPAIYNINNSSLQKYDFNSLIVYGFFNNFYINIPGPSYSQCTLEIEGLI
ncbi:hypothetical protein [Thermoanaerobacter sp. A7A]|uniref:hypothetical protein n=1 Tax=Thermoanaerobacter sp. A7A TaxID=1350366 RepID=UPI0004171911|nr:hypothetical protein [Thermoanaerobacter sp. A7A]